MAGTAAAAHVVPRKASSLLPRFQTLLASWQVDSERLSNFPGTPDVGVYLRQYVQTNVETDRVSYDQARDELVAAETLAAPDFFARYRNFSGGLDVASYAELRTFNIAPNSVEGTRIMRRIVYKDLWAAKKIVYGKKIMYGFVGLTVLMFALMAGNAIIRNKSING